MSTPKTSDKATAPKPMGVPGRKLTRQQAKSDSAKGRSSGPKKVSAKRSRAASGALKREGRSAASHAALSKQAKSAARKRKAS